MEYLSDCWFLKKELLRMQESESHEFRLGSILHCSGRDKETQDTEHRGRTKSSTTHTNFNVLFFFQFRHDLGKLPTVNH
jgi:hypothetical protein